MNFRPLPSLRYLRQFLDYDPETGAFTYREQSDLSAFKPKPGGTQSAEHMMAAWNGACAGKPALCSVNGEGYLYGRIRYQKISASRAAWFMHYGEEPGGMVDHINGNVRDNRIANLRVVDARENARNMATSTINTSGVAGVSCRSEITAAKPWTAYIGHNGKPFHLGHFRTRDEAIAARKAAERLLGYHPNHGRKRHPNSTPTRGRAV